MIIENVFRDYSELLTTVTIDKRKFNYSKSAKRGSFKNPFLKERDIIIGNNLSNSVNKVVSEVACLFTGDFSNYALIKKISN